MAAVLSSRPFQPKPQQNTLAAFLLAVMMHGGLVAALWVSVRWNVEPAGEVVAELWGAVPPPPLQIAPPPKIEQVAPPKPIEPPQRSEADIALEQEKKRRELELVEQQRREQEKLKQAQLEKERAKKEQAEKERREQERLKLAQLEKEREKERAEKERAEQEKREKERERLDATRAQERREAERARLLAQAGGSTAGGSSNAGASGGGGRGDPGYAGQLSALIRPKIAFAVPDGTSAAVYADYQIELLPTGEILAVKLLKASGLPGYDAAVERAIRRTDPFPRKRDGSIDRTVVIRFRPVDTQ